MPLPNQRLRTVAYLIAIPCVVAGIAWFVFRSKHGDPASPGVESAVDRSDELDSAWPFLRGAHYDGHSTETGLVDSWTDEGPRVVWTKPLGQGYSAFVAAHGRVYTQRQSLSGQFVVCLDAETGDTIWEYRYDWPYEAAGIYPGPRATPTLAEGRIYFAGTSGLIGCLSDTGTLLWSVNVMEKFRGKGAEFGYSCSPVVADGKVLIPTGGRDAAVVALDARDGSTIWQSGEGAASYMSPLPIVVEGRKQAIAYLENSLAAFDLDSGRSLWQMELSQGYDEHSAWPIYSEPHLWISAPFQVGSQLLDVNVPDGAAPRQVWQNRLLSNDICSSVLVAGAIYGFDLKDVQAKAHRPSRGKFRCLDFETGKELWSTDRTGHANVIVADGKLILFNDKGELILARAQPDEYEELARAEVFGGSICWTPPTLYRGRIYVRNQSQAACLSLRAFEEEPGSADRPHLSVADIPQSATVDMASILGVEPEYAFDRPSLESMRTWYFAGTLVLAAASGLTGLVSIPIRIYEGKWPTAAAWRVFGALSFLIGAAAITPISIWRQEFVFTWPLSLYIAFHATFRQLRFSRREHVTVRRRVWEWTVILVFLGVCMTYYLLCRRLSLVMEWMYLCGFVAAIPILFVERWWLRSGRNAAAAMTLFPLLGFTAYDWACVALMILRYPTP